jgi:hypothetical protein
MLAFASASADADAVAPPAYQGCRPSPGVASSQLCLLLLLLLALLLLLLLLSNLHIWAACHHHVAAGQLVGSSFKQQRHVNHLQHTNNERRSTIP